MSGNASRDAYEIAEELLSNRSASLQHPEALITASRAAERRRDELKSTEAASKHSDEISRLDHRAEELLDFAEKACERPELQTERAYNRLRVITQRVLFLHNSGRNQADTVLISANLANEAWMLLSKEEDIGTAARGEWYELEGDLPADHHKAVSAYRAGVTWAPEWNQLWVKCIGCCTLAGEEPPLNLLREMPVERIEVLSCEGKAGPET